jgi:hypothetical protein
MQVEQNEEETYEGKQQIFKYYLTIKQSTQQLLYISEMSH